MTKTRKIMKLENAGFLANMKVGQTMSWATQNNVSLKRLSFAFFLCKANGYSMTLEAYDAYKWITQGVALL